MSGTKKKLALDLGTKCGWATDDDSGCWDLRTKGDATRCMWGIYLSRLESVSPDVVFYEKVMAHRGTTAAHLYGALEAFTEYYCFQRQVPLFPVPVGTIKKHATGKGNANKSMMVAAAARKWPDLDIRDDNEVDALWLLDLANKGDGRGL